MVGETLNHKFSIDGGGEDCISRLHIHTCESVGTRDTWNTFELTEEELDNLRRVLGVGMGDCDHCEELKELKRLVVCRPVCEFAKSLSDEQDIHSYSLKRVWEEIELLKSRNEILTLALSVFRDKQRGRKTLDDLQNRKDETK